MMWGNFPATNDRDLKEQCDLARKELSFVPEADQRRFFGETALSLWPMLRSGLSSLPWAIFLLDIG